jgi:hypothetical protein
MFIALDDSDYAWLKSNPKFCSYAKKRVETVESLLSRFNTWVADQSFSQSRIHMVSLHLLMDDFVTQDKE